MENSTKYFIIASALRFEADRMEANNESPEIVEGLRVEAKECAAQTTAALKAENMRLNITKAS